MEGFIYYSGDALRNSNYLPKREDDNSSVFEDGECGEPLYEQRLIIDFTPNAVEDNEFNQKKCVEFWDFIHSMPQLKALMVSPEKQTADISETPKTITSEESIKPAVEGTGRTAVSVLKLIQKKGYIDRTFEAKMPQSTCTLGSREYKELEEVKQPKKKKKHAPCCYRPACQCPRSYEEPLPPLQVMIKSMDEWDAKHPKSMEPPGHPPSLQQCVLKRAYYSIPS